MDNRLLIAIEAYVELYREQIYLERMEYERKMENQTTLNLVIGVLTAIASQVGGIEFKEQLEKLTKKDVN